MERKGYTNLNFQEPGINELKPKKQKEALKKLLSPKTNPVLGPLVEIINLYYIKTNPNTADFIK